MTTNEFHQNNRTYYARGKGIIVEIEAVPASTSVIEMFGEKEKREKYLQARHTGFVRALSDVAFADEKEDLCKVGDKVLFASYAGRDLNRTIENRLPENEPLLRIMTAADIMCVIEDEPREEVTNV